MHSYKVSKKIKVVDWHRASGGNVSRTSRHFKIDRKRIREWDPKYKTLKQLNYGKQKRKRKFTNGAPVFSEEVNDALFEGFQRERDAGRAVSNRLLADEALRIAESLNLGNFKASTQYIKRWKQRFAVTMHTATNDSQKAPADCGEAVTVFHSTIATLRARHDYTPFNICNMDQTMVRMDNPATRTNNVAGENSIRIANTGCTRRGFTVALAARASRAKLPAFVVLKEPTGRIPAHAFMAPRIPSKFGTFPNKFCFVSLTAMRFLRKTKAWQEQRVCKA
uniref:Putative pogo transposable element n=1 Tax=Ixodes ricinus TaxID=34613 RepID=A0A6B0V6Y3_IXORI